MKDLIQNDKTATVLGIGCIISGILCYACSYAFSKRVLTDAITRL